jgi:hypothetical protein
MRATETVSNIAEVVSSSEARVGSDIIWDILSDTKGFSRILCQIDAIMVKENTGRFGSASRGRTSIIYVPSDLVKDSAFPFTDGDALLIRLVENAWLEGTIITRTIAAKELQVASSTRYRWQVALGC